MHVYCLYYPDENGYADDKIVGIFSDANRALERVSADGVNRYTIHVRPVDAQSVRYTHVEKSYYKLVNDRWVIDEDRGQ